MFSPQRGRAALRTAHVLHHERTADLRATPGATIDRHVLDLDTRQLHHQLGGGDRRLVCQARVRAVQVRDVCHRELEQSVDVEREIGRALEGSRIGQRRRVTERLVQQTLRVGQRRRPSGSR